MLYEMTTGVVPFAGETSADVIAAIVKTDPPPVGRLAPDIPVKLEEIVAKAFRKIETNVTRRSKICSSTLVA